MSRYAASLLATLGAFSLAACESSRADDASWQALAGTAATDTASAVVVAPATGDSTIAADAGAPEQPRAVMLPDWAKDWQGDTAALNATGPWLGLVLGREGPQLAHVGVRRERVEDVCFSTDSAKAWTDGLTIERSNAAIALLGEPRLTPGPVVAGIVLDNGDFDAFSDPNERARHVPDSARAVFGRDTLRFDAVPYAEGFRVVLRWRDVEEVLYEAEFQDEGSWNVRWVGDLDRDGVPDVLLDATQKYSVDATWLHLSAGATHPGRWRVAARYGQAGC